ncbi:MAG: tetratricopeptide repeat protein, partial [Myxococcales bacterium]|nr:tetratricopeptide repeat protein [Myxococcales bacterium]
DRAEARACTALVEGEQEAAVAHARLACLARAHGILGDTVEQLTTTTAEELARAPERLAELPVLAACDTLPPSVDACDPEQPVPGHEATVQAIGLKLQAAEVRIVLGRYDEGLALARAAIELTDADPDALAPLRARAWLLHGRLAVEGQHFAQALESLDNAQSLAEQQACDGVAAEALTLMAKVRALQLEADPEEALRWSKQALDKLDRLGDRGPRRADALNSRGLVFHQRLRRFEEADALYREAAELRERFLPATALPLSDTLLNRGAVLAQLGRLDDAVAALQRSIELRAEALGADHPSLYKHYVNLGNRQLERGKVVEAERALLRGLELARVGLGPQHQKIGELHLRIAAVLDHQRRFDEAIGQIRQALDVFDVALEPGALFWIDAWGAMGQVYLDAGNPREAIPWLTRAWDLVAEHPEADAVDRSAGAFRLGAAEALAGAPEQALPWLDRALELLAAGEGATEAKTLQAHIQLARGEALLEMTRPDEAIEALEHAVGWWDAHAGNPDQLARARWALARALLVEGAGPRDSAVLARADDLSAQARATFAQRSTIDPRLPRIDAWRVEHDFEEP